MKTTNYLSEKRRAANPWDGYCFYHLLRDGNGNSFPDGNKRYVIFDHEALVGEFFTISAGNEAFLDGVRVEGGIRRKDYQGLPTYNK